MVTKELISIPIEDLTFAVVDTETTGMNARHNRIMDIGIVKMKNGEVIEKWETLIDPEQEVPYWITGYTRLTTRHVKGKPKFKSFTNKINILLKDTIFVGHNVNFDYWFMYHEMQRAGNRFNYPKLCTVMLGRKLLPQLQNAHLDALSDHYNIEISARHRALPDAEATAFVLNEFITIATEKYKAKNFFDLEKLQKIKVDKDIARGTHNNVVLDGFNY